MLNLPRNTYFLGNYVFVLLFIHNIAQNFMATLTMTYCFSMELLRPNCRCFSCKNLQRQETMRSSCIRRLCFHIVLFFWWIVLTAECVDKILCVQFKKPLWQYWYFCIPLYCFLISCLNFVELQFCLNILRNQWG